MNIVVIGPPGAGKGTHAKRLINEFGLHYVSTGELLRENLEQQSGLGFIAQGYMDRGEMIPNEIVDAMIVDFLGKVSSDTPLLFNGFPRTTYQAEFLDNLFAKMERKVDAVLYLNTPDDEIINRLADRIICSSCQAPFHRKHNPFRACPYKKCQGEYLYHRDDDNPEMVRNRLNAYHRFSEPLIRYFQRTQRLFIVESEGDIEAVDAAMVNIVRAIRQNKAAPATSAAARQIRALKPTVHQLGLDDTIYPTLDLIFLGAPGAGKGTQAAHVSKAFDIFRIATGDIFRENIRNETNLGKIAKSYMDHGKLVPDDVTEAMVRDRISQPDVRHGFILDGFPRNLPQAEALTDMLSAMKRRLSGVLYLKVSDEEIIERLSGRLACTECQASFHTASNPFQSCSFHKCEGEHLSQRDDDQPDTVQARLEIFHGETEPLVDYYRQAGLLIEIEGEGEMSAVRQRVMDEAETLRTPQLE